MMDGEFCTSAIVKLKFCLEGSEMNSAPLLSICLFHLSCDQAEQGLNPGMREDEMVGWHH